MSGCLHVYALLDRPPDELPACGAFGEPLLQIEARSVVAVAGALDSAPADGEGAALAHAGVVEALATCSSALLPSRFGMRYADAAALRAAVEAEADGLRSALAAVRGCVEIGLTAVFPHREEPQPRTGREYLERRVAETRLVDGLVRDVHAPLERRARDARLEHGISPLRFGAAYLVERDEVEDFATAADRIVACADAVLVRSGPWPAYSFAAGGGGA